MKFENKEQGVYRNRLIVDLSAEGKTQSDIAKLARCSQCWVSKVLERHRADGESSLIPKVEQRGKTSQLSGDDFKHIGILLNQGALKHGFETDNWTRERIAVLIEKEFKVAYHPSHISKLMGKIGFTVQKPKPRAYEQSAEEVQKWREQTLLDLKKSP
jgi:transposase